MTVRSVSPIPPARMHHTALIVLVFTACMAVCLPVTAIPLPGALNLTDGAPVSPVSLSIYATPSEAHIGDTIVLNGTVTGITTIAVYLYLTGPGLDPRGVALENLNIAAGRGLFTTAPVKMSEGTWDYPWDTSVIIGNLKPGTYDITVVASPLDRLRSNPQESAMTTVNFSAAKDTAAKTPISSIIPVIALAAGAGLFFATAGKRR